MAQQTFGNYSSCCRLCLSENSSSLKSIFDGSMSRSSLSQQIHSNIGIEIGASDKLSVMICQSCIGMLNKWDRYKRSCLINQKTLELRMQNWNSHRIADVSLQIKDETVYDDDGDDDVHEVNDEEREGEIKQEPTETEQCRLDDSFEDFPPPLTPHPPEENNIFDEDSSTSFDNETVNNTVVPSGDAKVCNICDKVFSSVSNKNKHERTIHGKKDQEDTENNQSLITEVCLEDEASSGLPSCNGETNLTDSQPVAAVVDEITSESDQQKIQFAANLKLKLQHHASPSPNPYTFNGFTKTETSYLEKCKAMIKMNETLICVCHNEQLNSFKKVLQHIRKNPIWFPCFTCFNCMITFTDRSTYMKHYASCPKDKLRNLKRLADAKENTEMKVRLYQLYVCMLCNFIFAYHEDFCQHVNAFHVDNSETERSCKKCGTVFETADAVRRHMYLSSCIMNYRCDICGKIMGSMTEFKVHCEQVHDNSEGFTLEYKENCRKRASAPAELVRRSTEVKRRIREAPRLEPEGAEVVEEREKVINPHAVTTSKKKSSSACHICGKVYSSYHNMMRHAKIHDQSWNTLKCGHCPETFRLVVELKQHENEVHNINKPPDRLPERKSASNVKEFKYSCPECKAAFKDLVEFMKHKDMHRLPCGDCGKKFCSQNELDQHRSVHLNIKVYRDSKTRNYKSSMVSALLMCEVCDKIFNTKEELSQHKSLHEQMPVLTAQDRREDEKKDVTKKYSCQVCNKTYLGYGGLWDHNSKHHPGRKIPRQYPRQCKYCDKMLFNGGAWHMHKLMHERLTGQTPKLPNNLNHVNDVKSTVKKTTKRDSDDAESYYTCKKCFKVFSSKYSLRNHMKCHGINTNSTSRSQSKQGNKSKTYWCDVCHQACQGLAELQKHKKEHVEEAVPVVNNQAQAAEPLKKLHIFLCDLCDKDFTTKFALKKHKERHDLECTPIQKKRYFYCKHCKIPFKNMTILEDHMQGEHNESIAPKQHTNQVANATYLNKHPCNVCKKVFSTTAALSSHQGWHKRGKVEKQLRTQEKLFRKMVNSFPSKDCKTKQELQQTFQCLTCLAQFPNETALQIHVLETHRKIDTKQIVVFHCDPCNLDFETQLTYNKHQQLHKVAQQQQKTIQQPLKVADGQKVPKTYSCKYCPANFIRSDHLNAHVKEKHPEFVKKNFKCTICDRVFEKQNALSTHLKVHERQKQVVGTEKSIDKLPKKFYSCSICHVGFPIAKDLRNHIISTHPF